MTESILPHLVNTAIWIVLVLFVAAVLSVIWAVVDTSLSKWSYLMRAAGPSSVRKPVQATVLSFRRTR